MAPGARGSGGGVKAGRSLARLAAANWVVLLLAACLVEPAAAARPPPAALSQQPQPPPARASATAAVPPNTKIAPSVDDAAAPDGSLPSNIIASRVRQVPLYPPPLVPPAAPRSASNSRVAAATDLAPAPAPPEALERNVSNSQQLLAALQDPDVAVIRLQNNVTIVEDQWALDGSLTVNRNVTLLPAFGAASQTIALDFGRLPFVIVLSPDGILTVRNLLLRGVAPAAAGLRNDLPLDAQSTFRVVGLSLWPSLGALPGAQFFLESSKVYVADNSGYVNCTLFQARFNLQSQQIYGRRNVSTVDDGVLVSGEQLVSLPIQEGNIVSGNATLTTRDITTACQLNDGRFYGRPPRPNGDNFPTWAGVLIGIGLGLLLVGVLIACLLWRRKVSFSRRRRGGMFGGDEEESGGKKDPGGTSYTTSTTTPMKGSSAGGKGSLWNQGSQGLESQDSGEVRSLASYHKQLLAMRQASGLDGIEVGPILGRGSYGRVYKGRWNGALVAIKVIDTTPFADAATVDSARESLLAASMSHPNVVACYKICAVRLGDQAHESGEVAVPPELAGVPPADKAAASVASEVPVEEVPNHEQDVLETWMLLEYADRGSLEQAVKSKRFTNRQTGRLDLLAVYKSALDVAWGMSYLHSLGIIHGDLKPANVLLKSTVTDARGFICKLTDFGLSRILDLNSTHISTQSFGTVPYMPPELLSAGRMTTAVDVYSFGVMCCELFTGTQPYSGMAFGQVMYNVVHGTLRPEVPADCPPAFAALMRSCWAPAADRPSFDSISAELDALVKQETAAVAAAAAAAKSASAAAAKPAAASRPASPDTANEAGLVPVAERGSGGENVHTSARFRSISSRTARTEAADGGGKVQPSGRSFRDFLNFLRPSSPGLDRASPLGGGDGGGESVSGRRGSRRQMSSAAAAARVMAPRADSITGEWRPRAASVTGNRPALHGGEEFPVSVHRKSASASLSAATLRGILPPEPTARSVLQQQQQQPAAEPPQPSADPAGSVVPDQRGSDSVSPPAQRQASTEATGTQLRQQQQQQQQQQEAVAEKRHQISDTRQQQQQWEGTGAAAVTESPPQPQRWASRLGDTPIDRSPSLPQS